MTIELTGDNANVILDDGLIFNTTRVRSRGSNAPPPVTGNTFGLIHRRSTTRPAYWVGGAADRSDIQDRPKSFGTHFATHQPRTPTSDHHVPRRWMKRLPDRIGACGMRTWVTVGGYGPQRGACWRP